MGVDSVDLPLSISRETLLQYFVPFLCKEVARYVCRTFETFDDYTVLRTVWQVLKIAELKEVNASKSEDAQFSA